MGTKEFLVLSRFHPLTLIFMRVVHPHLMGSVWFAVFCVLPLGSVALDSHRCIPPPGAKEHFNGCRRERLFRQQEDFLPKLSWSVIFSPVPPFVLVSPHGGVQKLLRRHVGNFPQSFRLSCIQSFWSVWVLFFYLSWPLTFDLTHSTGDLFQTSAEEQPSLFWITSRALMAFRSRADQRFCSQRLNFSKMTPIYSFTFGLLTFGILSHLVKDKHKGGTFFPFPSPADQHFQGEFFSITQSQKVSFASAGSLQLHPRFPIWTSIRVCCPAIWDPERTRKHVCSKQKDQTWNPTQNLLALRLTTAPPCYTDGIVLAFQLIKSQQAKWIRFGFFHWWPRLSGQDYPLRGWRTDKWF